jgi:isopenicillin N synthase-like dioxygenase
MTWASERTACHRFGVRRRKDRRSVCLRGCTGFFYLQGHGIAPELCAAVFRETKAFFDLPLGEKVALSANAASRGYTRLNEEILAPELQSQGDTKEGYYIGREDAVSTLPLHGVNVWPEPSLLPGWRDTMEAYSAALTALGTSALRCLNARRYPFTPGCCNLTPCCVMRQAER